MSYKTILIVSLGLLCPIIQASQGSTTDLQGLIDGWSELDKQQSVEYCSKRVVEQVLPKPLTQCDSCFNCDCSSCSAQEMRKTITMCVPCWWFFVIKSECSNKPEAAGTKQLEIEQFLANKYNLNQVNEFTQANQTRLSYSCRAMLENLHIKMK